MPLASNETRIRGYGMASLHFRMRKQKAQGLVSTCSRPGFHGCVFTGTLHSEALS